MAEPDRQIDWRAIEESPEFQELVHRRRSFVIPGTIFFLTAFMAFILVTAYAPDFMGERVYQGLTVGYLLALTQFLMVFVLGIWYLRKSENEFDPLAERAIRGYAQREGVTDSGSAHAGRREPDSGAVPAERKALR